MGSTSPLARLTRVSPKSNAYTFKFDDGVLADLRGIYHRGLAGTLAQPDILPVFAGGKTVGGTLNIDEHSFSLTSYRKIPLFWVAANGDSTFAVFKRFFLSLGIGECVKGLVDHDDEIMLYCGFFVIGNRMQQLSWHTDYNAGANAYTLLTPLFEPDCRHGHLLYRGDDRKGRRYRYRLGEAIILGDGFVHATEPYAPTSEFRVLISLTFGTDKLAYWPILRETIETQSRYLILPCGHQLGKCSCLSKPRP